MKQQCEEVIKEMIKETNWNRVSEIKLRERMGYLPKDELNKLYKEGKIKVHEGINCKIIEYVTK